MYLQLVRKRVLQCLIQSTQILVLLYLLFSFAIFTYRVVGSPLLWSYNFRFFLFALGSVTGRSLNRGYKGWEGSRDDLYWRLPSKRIKDQGFCHLGTKLVLPLLTPPPEGGEVLSRTVRRGR